MCKQLTHAAFKNYTMANDEYVRTIGNDLLEICTDTTFCGKLSTASRADKQSIEFETARLYQVPFLCGDGSGQIMLDVFYVAGGFPRDRDSACAFCHGDPCNEMSDADSLISQYFARNKHAETCPCCRGQQS